MTSNESGGGSGSARGPVYGAISQTRIHWVPTLAYVLEQRMLRSWRPTIGNAGHIHDCGEGFDRGSLGWARLAPLLTGWAAAIVATYRGHGRPHRRLRKRLQSRRSADGTAGGVECCGGSGCPTRSGRRQTDTATSSPPTAATAHPAKTIVRLSRVHRVPGHYGRKNDHVTSPYLLAVSSYSRGASAAAVLAAAAKVEAATVAVATPWW